MQRRACAEGKHAFGIETAIGAGLTRSRCKYCGTMSIDLSVIEGDGACVGVVSTGRAGGPSDGAVQARGLFGRRQRVTIFDIEQALTSGLLDADVDP